MPLRVSISTLRFDFIERLFLLRINAEMYIDKESEANNIKLFM